MTTKKLIPKKTVAKRVSSAKAEPAPALSGIKVFSMQGKEVNTLTLPSGIFGAKWNADLVHQVTTALAANKRQNRAHTKDRSEVAGGGKKPWKQKGTGQARHGSTRSPIWRHGGVTFGPRTERNYHEKINRKMKIRALLSVLSRKARDGEIILVDKLTFSKPRTAEAKKAFVAITKAAQVSPLNKNAALIALSSFDANAVKSFRNLGTIATEEVRNLNPLTVLSYRYLIIENPEKAFEMLAERVKN